MRPKSFVIIFIAYVYTIDILTMGSHRDNMCSGLESGWNIVQKSSSL